MKAIFKAGILALAGVLATGAASAKDNKKKTEKVSYSVTLNLDLARDTISRMIYGQFAEHLGACVYEGIWVGKNSPIPNTQGYRNDALEALRALKVPVLRWPGGCFADDYHWRDGIGDPAKRPTLINNNWGGTQEDNSFGTHEFFNLCELAGIEPYLSVNIGSGTVQEAAQWIEYVTAPNGPMAAERAANGRKEPWHLKYVGIGNESWGCGGHMRPEYYSDVYRRYSTYMRNQPGNKLFRIASGASDYDYNWTETLMDRVGARHMNGLSLHYYTCATWSGSKGSATTFDDKTYYTTIGKCLELEPVLERHIDIMNAKDSKNKVGLMVDEWGTWFDEEPGSTPGHLYQQNTMRDAMVAALSLNIFHRHSKRVKMANIAQLANVLQAMWLTKGDKMVLTPTYYVFKMYTPHMDAVNIPLGVQTHSFTDANGREVPALSATASEKNGRVTVTLTNPTLDREETVSIDLPEGVGTKVLAAEILTAPDVHAMNTFDNPDAVKTVEYKGAKVEKGRLTVTLPPVSVVSVTL